MPTLPLTPARLGIIAGHRIEDVAASVGLESVPAFRRAFEQTYYLSPEDYRALPACRSFEIGLPRWLRRQGLYQYWGRDPTSRSERVDGRRISWCTHSWIGPVRVDAELGEDRARITFEGQATSDPLAAFHVHEMVLRWLGLHLDPNPFEEAVESGPHARLIAGRHGLTLPQTGSVFDAALWVVAGQQVSLAAAFSIRRRLTERFGTPVAGLVCSPPASRVAEAEPEELFEHGLTRRKAEYLSGMARSAGPAAVDLPTRAQPLPGLEGWRAWSEDVAEKNLLAVRGLGAWSVNYLLMRALGFRDRVPVGDAALRRALQRFYGLDERPNPERTLELLAPFAPYRSLASFHFWATLASD